MIRAAAAALIGAVAACGPVPQATDFSDAPTSIDPRERAYRECVHWAHRQTAEVRLREALRTCMESKGYTLRQ
jgi:hypothetical protein